MKKTLKRGLAALMTVVLLVSMIVVVPAVAASSLNSITITYSEGIGLYYTAEDGNFVDANTIVGESTKDFSGFTIKKESYKLTFIAEQSADDFYFAIKPDGPDSDYTVASDNECYNVEKTEGEEYIEYTYDFASANRKQQKLQEKGINFTITKSVSYTINFPTSVEKGMYLLNSSDLDISGAVTVNMDDEYTFKVVSPNRYVPQVSSVAAGKSTKIQAEIDPSTEGEYTTYTFKIPSDTVKQNPRIVVSGEDKTFTVKTDSSGKFTTNIGESDHVSYGGSYTFEVVPYEGYNKPKVEYSMGQADKVTLTSASNSYTIRNITGDIVITITDQGAVQRTVRFNKVDGATISSDKTDIKDLTTEAQKAANGNLYTFYVILKDGYTKSVPTVSLSDGTILNGTRETDVNAYKFEINPVTSDLAVTVNNVTKNVYTVKFTDDEGYAVTNGAATVTHGENYTFTITADAGYEKPNVTATGIESVSEPAKNGNRYTYTINSVEKDLDITIKGSKTKVNITNEYSDDAGSNHAKVTLDGSVENQIDYNSPLKFTVEIDKGYKATSVYGQYDDGSTTGELRGTTAEGKTSYTIPGLTKPVAIKVDTAKTTVTVVYKNAGGPNSAERRVRYQIQDANVGAVDTNVELEKPMNKGDTKFTASYYYAAGYSLVKDGAQQDSKENLSDIEIPYTNEDAEYEIYVNWNVDPELLYEATIDGTTTANYLDLLSRYEAKAREVVDVLNREEGADAKIVKFGFLLSNKTIDPSKATAETINDLSSSGADVSGFDGSQKVIAYYGTYSADTDPSGSIHVRFTNLKSGVTRCACAFVLIKSHEKLYLICSDCQQWNINY